MVVHDLFGQLAPPGLFCLEQGSLVALRCLEPGVVALDEGVEDLVDDVAKEAG